MYIRCSTSLIIKAGQIKTILSYCYIPIRKTKIKIIATPNTAKYIEKLSLVYCYWKYISTLKNSLSVSLKIKINLLYDPVIVLLGIYFREMRSYFHE